MSLNKDLPFVYILQWYRMGSPSNGIFVGSCLEYEVNMLEGEAHLLREILETGQIERSTLEFPGCSCLVTTDPRVAAQFEFHNATLKGEEATAQNVEFEVEWGENGHATFLYLETGRTETIQMWDDSSDDEEPAEPGLTEKVSYSLGRRKFRKLSLT